MGCVVANVNLGLAVSSSMAGPPFRGSPVGNGIFVLCSRSCVDSSFLSTWQCSMKHTRQMHALERWYSEQ